MQNIILAFLLAGAFDVTAGLLPDCTERRFEQNGRLITVMNDSDEAAMQVIKLLSAGENERFLFSSMFPRFKENEMIIYTRFFHGYEAPQRKIIDHILQSIAALDGVTIACVPFVAPET